MARRTRETQFDRAPSPAPIGKTLLIVAAFVVAAVAGVLFIRSRVGPSRSVVDVEALERLDTIRTASIDAVQRSEQLIRDGKIDEAVRLLQQVTESDPNFYLGHLMLGYMFMHADRLPLAAKATRRAYQLEPGDFAVNYQMGQIELLEGKSESAVEFLSRAIEESSRLGVPPAAEYHMALADALTRSGQSAQAGHQMELALGADRQGAIQAAATAGPAAQVALGRALVRQGDVEEAARLFARAAEQRPDRADWHFLAARAYFVQAKFAQAAPLIQKAVDLDPTNASYVRLKQQIDSKQSGRPPEPIAEPLLDFQEPNVPDLFTW